MQLSMSQEERPRRNQLCQPLILEFQQILRNPRLEYSVMKPLANYYSQVLSERALWKQLEAIPRVQAQVTDCKMEVRKTEHNTDQSWPSAVCTDKGRLEFRMSLKPRRGL